MTSPTVTPTASTPSRARRYGSWALRIAFGLLFLFAGGAKLIGAPAMVAEFEQVGLGQWFRYFTAILEIGGAALLLWPRAVFYGAAVLTVVSVGAFFAQLLVPHQDWIHAVIFALILGGIAYAYRGQLQTKAS